MPQHHDVHIYSPNRPSVKKFIANILLTKREFLIDEKDNDGYLPIHAASNQGRTDVIALILQKIPEEIRSGHQYYGLSRIMI